MNEKGKVLTFSLVPDQYSFEDYDFNANKHTQIFIFNSRDHTFLQLNKSSKAYFNYAFQF